jgi:sugar phosphate isomerase/epimerase
MMKVFFFCPLWGCEKQPFRGFAKNVKAAGYDGVEMGFPNDPHQKRDRLQILKDEGLLLIAQHSKTHDADFKTHKKPAKIISPSSRIPN